MGACAQTPDLFPGYPVLAMIDPVVSGWNETCLKDTDGGYCNGECPYSDEIFWPFCFFSGQQKELC